LRERTLSAPWLREIEIEVEVGIEFLADCFDFDSDSDSDFDDHNSSALMRHLLEMEQVRELAEHAQPDAQRVFSSIS
jgi:hypothetical protein